jgi:hypothetical protein
VAGGLGSEDQRIAAELGRFLDELPEEIVDVVKDGVGGSLRAPR